jgi:hypothetical protein
MEKQSSNSINWFFRWGVGGYNSVMASTREEAMQKAEALGSGWQSGGVRDLQPDPDRAETEKMDKAYAGMFD